MRTNRNLIYSFPGKIFTLAIASFQFATFFFIWCLLLERINAILFKINIASSSNLLKFHINNISLIFESYTISILNVFPPRSHQHVPREQILAHKKVEQGHLRLRRHRHPHPHRGYPRHSGDLVETGLR